MNSNTSNLKGRGSISYAWKETLLEKLCLIWYHLHNLKTWKDLKLAWVLFTFFKLCKWYQIPKHVQSITLFTVKEEASALPELTYCRCLFQLPFTIIFRRTTNKINNSFLKVSQLKLNILLDGAYDFKTKYSCKFTRNKNLLLT